MDDDIRPLYVCGGKAECGIVAAAIDEGVEQDDLVAVGELEIGESGPAHRERVRVARGRPSGRYELRRQAGRILRRGGEVWIGIDGIEALGTWIEEWARQCGARRQDRCRGGDNSKQAVHRKLDSPFYCLYRPGII
jgi:hypothetical protein